MYKIKIANFYQKTNKKYCKYYDFIGFVPLLLRLLEEGICDEKKIPSISSINRIIRDKSMTNRRGEFGDDVRQEI